MIRFDRENHVGTIAIDAPCTSMDDLEALTVELSDIRSLLNTDDRIRVLVLSGLEKITWPINTEPRENIEADGLAPVIGIRQPSARIADLDRPTIAAIDGNAQGLGLELALACDLRVAAKTSRFGLPQLQTGILPWDGGTQRLPRLVGRAKALEMILTGCSIDAREAWRIGLVNRVLDGDKSLDETLKMAHEMAAMGPIALRYVRESVYKGMDLTLEQGLRLEMDLYLLLHTTRDRTEGVRAFQERRQAEFLGE
jgi:enoyl-CoA hydratase/carnithine racemase